MPSELDIATQDDADASAAWSHLVDKITQTAMLLVFAKLIAAWVVVAAWGIELQSRLLWGFIPYAGLQTSPAQFRTVSAWSTAIVALIAGLWTLGHFVRRHKRHVARTWAAAAAIPMAAMLTVFEWMRRFDADHLIPTAWLVRILLFLAVAAVLFLGFIEYPNDEARDEATQTERPTSFPKISAQP